MIQNHCGKKLTYRHGQSKAGPDWRVTLVHVWQCDKCKQVFNQRTRLARKNMHLKETQDSYMVGGL